MANNRRNFLKITGAGLSTAILPAWAHAQGNTPIPLGMLLPLTGANSTYGGSMAQAAKRAAQEINTAGGVLGRPIDLIIEDDQTNPESALRAVRKLIGVNRVPAIGGSHTSSITAAIAPLFWQNKVVMGTSAGADTITQMPHEGYIFRTSPTSTLQGTRLGEFAIELKSKNIFFMAPQTPFTQNYIDVIGSIAKKGGATMGSLVYEDKKASYRSEVDQVLRTNPDMIIFGGYVPDTAILVKDLYRAGYTGKAMGLSFGVNQALVEALSGDVGEGIYSLDPAASVKSQTYKRLTESLQVSALDTYSCQCYDHVNLFALALARAGSVSGTAIRDNIRAISQDHSATIVENGPDGIKLLAAGKAVNYDGASGPCEFKENGDVSGVFFRYQQIQKGKLVTVKIA